MVESSINNTMKEDIFLSYFHEDAEYKDKFEEIFADLINNKTVRLHDTNMTSNDYIDTIINENNITNSSVVIVLTGSKTYKRKHVDWDIYAALKQKTALIGICLPNRNDYRLNKFITETFPHRLVDNVTSGYASINKWTEDYDKMSNIIKRSHIKSENINLINNRRSLQSKDYHFCGATGCDCH